MATTTPPSVPTPAVAAAPHFDSAAGNSTQTPCASTQTSAVASQMPAARAHHSRVPSSLFLRANARYSAAPSAKHSSNAGTANVAYSALHAEAYLDASTAALAEAAPPTMR